MRLYRLFLLLAFAPVLGASSCRKDKDKEEEVEIEPTPVEVELRITGVEPDRVNAGESVPARIYGAGFKPGAQVRVDEVPVTSVTVIDENQLSVTLPALRAGSREVRVRNPDGQTATLRNAILVEERMAADPTSGLDCNAITVGFAFDSSALEGSAIGTLQRHLPCFTGLTGGIVVGGHADERGTTDYNLALGQRRADAVKRWLTSQSIAPGRIRAVSFGEERPADPGHDETAWARNRRAEISVSR